MDAWRDLIEAIAQGGGPACDAQTIGDLVRWFYELTLPYIAEEHKDKIRQRTKQLWRKALAGEFEPIEVNWDYE